MPAGRSRECCGLWVPPSSTEVSGYWCHDAGPGHPGVAVRRPDQTMVVTKDDWLLTRRFPVLKAPGARGVVLIEAWCWGSSADFQPTRLSVKKKKSWLLKFFVLWGSPGYGYTPVCLFASGGGSPTEQVAPGLSQNIIEDYSDCHLFGLRCSHRADGGYQAGFSTTGPSTRSSMPEAGDRRGGAVGAIRPSIPLCTSFLLIVLLISIMLFSYWGAGALVANSLRFFSYRWLREYLMNCLKYQVSIHFLVPRAGCAGAVGAKLTTVRLTTGRWSCAGRFRG